MENLEQQLGLSLGSSARQTVLRVDNGDNKMGKNATGEFVEKVKDEAGNFTRKKFGKLLSGVVLLSRARLMGSYVKGEKPWWTPEFNPLMPTEPIKIVKGKKIMAEVTYKEIKSNPDMTKTNSDGSKSNNFSYITVLYLDDGQEIRKVELTGRSRGNWIDYSSALSKAGKSLLKQKTKLSIVESDEGSFECKFETDGEVENQEDILSKAVHLLQSANSGALMLGSKDEEVPLPEEPTEVKEKVEEINVDDIPF